ncbi:MAG: hypothetical protein ACT4OK_13310 [Gemmobacter sp.]
MLLIRLQQRPLFGFLVNPFGASARAIELQGDHLLVTGRSMPASVSLADIGEAPVLRKGALATTLSLQSSGQSNVMLRGAGHADARSFADSVKAAWVKFNTDAFNREAQRFDRLHAAVFGLSRPGRYPAACSLAPILQDARSLDTTLVSCRYVRMMVADETPAHPWDLDPAGQAGEGISRGVRAGL